VTNRLVHHSDRGVQYACGDYIGRLQAHAIQPSMSRVGCPYDNAMAESFMKTLKQEEVDGRSYRNLAQARQAIEYFLSEVYNRQRLHSALAYNAPAEVEANPTLLLSVIERSTAGSNPICPDLTVSR
jgi:transposase InsO family protein